MKNEQKRVELYVLRVNLLKYSIHNYLSSLFTFEELGNIPEPNQTFLASGRKWLTQIIFTEENSTKQLKGLKDDKSNGLATCYHTIMVSDRCMKERDI